MKIGTYNRAVAFTLLNPYLFLHIFVIIRLIFLDPTRIEGSEETPHVVVNVGEPIDLICDASGVPVPVLTWTKSDDQPLIDSSRVLSNGRRMFVESAQVSVQLNKTF